MAGNRWAKIDLGYWRNPKITSVSVPAAVLHLASILWSADQLTDGHIPARTLPELLTSARTTAKRADELVRARLWLPNDDGWHVHDFEKMNPQALRAVVERQRAEWRERQQKRRR